MKIKRKEVMGPTPTKYIGCMRIASDKRWAPPPKTYSNFY